MQLRSGPPTLALKQGFGRQTQTGMTQLQEPRQPGNLLCLVFFRLCFLNSHLPELKGDCVPPQREAEIMAEHSRKSNSWNLYQETWSRMDGLRVKIVGGK